MDNFNLRKYLAEGKLQKQGKSVKENRVADKDIAKEIKKLEDENPKGFEKEISKLKVRQAAIDLMKESNTLKEGNGLSQHDLDYLEGLADRTDNEKLKKIVKVLAKTINLSESKLLNEFVGKELEDRNEPLYDKLVPGSGKADTVEGEMLRAINRIVYRYYNDGDEYHTGYGTETAGPAHSFLVNANHPLKSLVSTLFKTGTNYEQTIKDVLDAILDHIESRQGKYTPNSEDMYDYEPEFEDDEFEEEDYDYDYDFDDEDDYDEF